MGPNLFVHNENSAYVMPHVTAHAVMSCAHPMVHAHRQASCPYEIVAHQKLLMDMPLMPAKLYLIKLTASHFSTLNTRLSNQNVLKMILIAMHNENKADYNENFRICAEESIDLCTSGRLQNACRDGDITITILVLVNFKLIKLKSKAKYKSISDTLHLLSAPVSIPCVGTVLASLVVDSL